MNNNRLDVPQSNNSSRHVRRSKPLALAGDVRDQRRNRGILLRALKGFRRECLRDARRTERILEQLERLTIEAISEGGSGVRKALVSVAELDSPEYQREEVGEALRDLIGAQDDWVAEQVIRFGRERDEVETHNTDASIDEVSEPKAFTAEAALADAARIIAATSDAELDEIDWTENPKSERERALRAAIISRIEVDEAQLGNRRSDGTTYSALYVLNALEQLAPGDADVIGKDLYSAIERWERARDEERKQNERIEKRRLLNQARRDVDGRT